MNILEIWTHGKKDEQLNVRNYVKNEIERNLNCYLYKCHRDTYINESRLPMVWKNRKDFAEIFAHAIQSDDVYEAIDAVNDYRNIMRNSASILSDKFGGSYFVCDDCDSIGHYDNSCSVNEGNRCVCEQCREDNYRWSEYYDSYVDDDYDEPEEEPEYENIGSYHSSSSDLGHIPSKYDQRKPRVLLGLELEMECKTSYSTKDDKAGQLIDAIGNYNTEDGGRYTYALCEEDGSLDNGFEMVTAYTGLDVHREQLQFFKNTFSGMSSHNTSTCGLHVHICKADMTTLHGAKMVLFINDADNQKLVYAIARRDASSYAKIHDKKGDKHWLKDAITISKNSLYDQKKSILRNLNQDRYEALNFRNDRTIEFRLFKGTLKYQTIMACLEFTFATWHFCKDAGQNELTTSKFLDFICQPENRADTRFLRSYLRDKGFSLPDAKTAKTVAIPELV